MRRRSAGRWRARGGSIRAGRASSRSRGVTHPVLVKAEELDVAADGLPGADGGHDHHPLPLTSSKASYSGESTPPGLSAAMSGRAAANWMVTARPTIFFWPSVSGLAPIIWEVGQPMTQRPSISAWVESVPSFSRSSSLIFVADAAGPWPWREARCWRRAPWGRPPRWGGPPRRRTRAGRGSEESRTWWRPGQ